MLIRNLQVNGYAADQLDHALEGVNVVVIPAGVPRKVCASPFTPIRIATQPKTIFSQVYVVLYSLISPLN